MAGTTYSKFFWQDWQGDLELKTCSMAAQGWWMRLLCVAGSANDRGRVVIAGKRPTPTVMRRVTAVEATDAEIRGWEQELIDAKVCDLDPDRVMVSRRQRRQALGINAHSAGGKARARSAARNGGKFAPADHQQDAPAASPAVKNTAGGGSVSSGKDLAPAHQQVSPATINHQPESINHQPQIGVVAGTLKKIIEASGVDPTTSSNFGLVTRWRSQIEAMIFEGIDIDLDLVPAIREVKSRGGIPADLGGPAFFRKSALQIRDERKLKAEIGAARASQAANPETVDFERWRIWMRTFVVTGIWDGVGPAPVDEGCLAPPDIIEAGRKRWVATRNQPEVPCREWQRPPTPFFGDNVVPLRKAQ